MSTIQCFMIEPIKSIFKYDAFEPPIDTIFKRLDTGEEKAFHAFSVGAMWDASWKGKYRGPDNRCICVKTPGGLWCIDGPSTHKPAGTWKRSGVLPDISVNPSIYIQYEVTEERAADFDKIAGLYTVYHGVLTEGRLVSTPDSPC